MSFAYPLVLLALVAVPLLGWWAWRRDRSAALPFSDTGAARGLPPTLWVRLRRLPLVLRLLALTLAILALARPQERNVSRERVAEGIDIALVLDLSTSMRASDFYPNRFEAARRVAAEFIDGRVSDRIGLVVFAAQAYTQAPLTLDYRFLKQMLSETRMGVIDDGTAIGTAIATATARLREATGTSKVLILLTDGENNRGEVDPATAAEVAAAYGVKVYAIGVGSVQETTVRQRDPFGNLVAGRAPGLDERTLETVAATTGGRYFRATDEEALRRIYAEISDLERTKVEEKVYVDVEERYPWFLVPALVLVLLELALATTRLREIP